MKNTKIICILFLLSRFCFAQNNSNNIIQESKTRFYDFNISVEINDNVSGLTMKKFLIYNNENYYDDKSNVEIKCLENSLYVITNQIKKKENKHDFLIEKSDTLVIKLTNTQMDSIFDLTQATFYLKYTFNLDILKYPPAIISANNTSAKVIFDLGFRGNKYVQFIKYGDSDVSENYHFIILLNFLKNIKP